MSALRTNLKNSDNFREDNEQYENILSTPVSKRTSLLSYFSEYNLPSYLNQEYLDNYSFLNHYNPPYSPTESQLVSIIMRQLSYQSSRTIQIAFCRIINSIIKIRNGILDKRRIKVIHQLITNTFLTTNWNKKLILSNRITMTKFRKMMGNW